MKWPTVEALTTLIPLPPGYRFALLGRPHIASLVGAIKTWHPSISVGIASGYLREDFYHNRASLDGEAERDILVVRIMFNEELAGVWSFEREVDSLAVYGRLIILAPEHRGKKLSVHAMAGTENIGRAMGAAFMYALATLKDPYVQRALESAGYRLLGFFPGYDREEVAPGVVKRMYQAVYAKLLVPEEQVHWPDPTKMTPKARALFELLFSDRPAALTR
jgi:hypothetical protein